MTYLHLAVSISGAVTIRLGEQLQSGHVLLPLDMCFCQFFYIQNTEPSIRNTAKLTIISRNYTRTLYNTINIADKKAVLIDTITG